MLALIKRRTLALLRKGIEPVEQVAFARFLAEWQGVGSDSRGVDAVLGAIEQLSGYPIPASAVESMILPARVASYSSSMLDELTATGEIFWVGDGPIGDSDGWVRWYVAGQEPHASRGEPGAVSQPGDSGGPLPIAARPSSTPCCHRDRLWPIARSTSMPCGSWFGLAW